MKRWRILLSFLCGSIALACSAFVPQVVMKYPAAALISMLTAFMMLLLCMSLAQDDGAARNSRPNQ